MICRRSRMVWARNSVSSKMVPSGQKVTVVPVRGSPVLRSFGRRAGGGDLALELAALLELGLPVLAVAVDLEHEPGRQGVDHRDADAVQAARDLVALAAELAAGVQGGQDDLGRRDCLGFLGWGPTGMPAPSSLTRQPPSASRVTSIRVARPGHGLVDRVVHDLPDQVVQARRAGRADVHARAASGPPRVPRGW